MKQKLTQLGLPKNQVDKEIDKATKPRNLYWIAFKRGFMTPPELFCGTKEDFTHLSGSIIYLNGMAFAPPIFDIFYLAQKWQDTHLIDETVSQTVRRYLLQEFLKEQKTLFLV